MSSRSTASLDAAPAAPGSLRRVLRRRHLRTLLAARWTSQLSDGAFQAALASFLLFSPQHAASAAQLAALLGVTLLPFSALGPFVGVALDRWPRQPIMVRVALARAVLSIVVAVELAVFSSNVPLFATVLVSLSLNRFYLSNQGASLPRVVPAEDLLTGNALAATGGTILALVGGAVGVVLARLTSGAAVEVATALLYAVSGLVAVRLPRGLLGPDGSAPRVTDELRRVLGDLTAGLRVITASRRASAALAAIFVARYLIGLLFVATLLALRYDLGTREAGLAVVLAGTVAGSVAAAIGTPRLGRRLSGTSIIRATLLTSAVAVLATAPFVARGQRAYGPELDALAVVLGATAAALKIAVDTTVQVAVPDGYRGRVFSLYDILYNVAFVAAAVTAVVLVPANGRSGALFAAAGCLFAATALAHRLFSPAAPRLRSAGGDRRR